MVSFSFLCSSIILFYFERVETTTYVNNSAISENSKPNKPVVLHLLGLPKRGTYVVKEEIEKAPVHDHPCNLTETVVKITFPEMESEVFISLLGYKGSNMIHLQRCKGRCADSDSSVSCTATKVREKKVKMTVRSFLTGGKHRERLKELILDDHMECGCECDPQLSSECEGMFNEVTCECVCPAWEFGEKKVVCEMRRDHYWDSQICKCVSKNVAPRGVDLYNFKKRCANHDQSGIASAERQLDLIKVLNSSDTRGLDMIAWVLLGSSLTLVLVLAVATGHYRRQLRNVKNVKKGKNEEDTKEIIKEELKNGQIKTNADHFSYVGNSDSTNSMDPSFSSREYQEDFLTYAKKLKKTKLRSSENILIGLQGTQHVEIGGEIYYQPFDQQNEHVENQCYS